MGTWGTGIFDSDTAAEVRDFWREAVLDGLDPVAATQRVRSEPLGWDDPNDSAIAWLALALAQHETGRLQDDVRDRALAVIAAGADLEQWLDENPAAAKRRAKALERLQAKLTGPQPKAKRLRRTKAVVGTWFDAGDIVLVYGDDGSEALFAVVQEGHEPTVVPLLWKGGAIPSRSELERLPGLLAESRARWQAPERLGTIFREAHRVTTMARDELFDETTGRIVARGVLRPDLAPRLPPTSSATWSFLAAAISKGAYLRELMKDTPRLLALVADGADVLEWNPWTGRFE